MNTFGKILVICNFLIALAVAAFFGVDFATRQNWKKGYDELKDELTVFKSKDQATTKTSADLNIQVKKSEEDKKTVEKKYVEEIDKWKAAVNGKDADLVEKDVKIAADGLSLQISLEEKKRLEQEVTGLLNTLKKREGIITSLELEITKHRNQALANLNEAATLRIRVDNLQGEIRRLTQVLAELQNKGSGGTLTNIVKDPNAPNPPSVAVKGQVEKVDAKDKTLVRLSVGSDHGVNKNHTLEVYRTAPRAEYLGTIRIMESMPHYSIGKMMRPGQQYSPLQAGDTVVGSLTP